MTSTNHFRNRELSTNLRSPVSPRRRRKHAVAQTNPPHTVAGVFECSAPGYACPISEGPSFGSYTFISGQTWRRERNVYGTVFIAVEVDIVPSAGTIYFRGYIKCSGTWAQVADLTYTGWDGTYPLSLIEQSLTVTDPNVDSMQAGLDLT